MYKCNPTWNLRYRSPFRSLFRLLFGSERRHATLNPVNIGDMVKKNPSPPPYKPLYEYTLPSWKDCGSTIVRPPIIAKSFKIKPSVLQLMQQHPSDGWDNEDTRKHMSRFLEICDISKYAGVFDDAFCLALFSFSLRDRARDWLDLNMDSASITT